MQVLLQDPYHAGNVGKMEFSTQQSKLTRRNLSGGPATRLKHWCDPIQLWTPKREHTTEIPTTFVKNAVAERNNRIVLAAEEEERRKLEITEADMEAEEKAMHAAAPLIEKLRSDYSFLLSQMRHKSLTEKERQDVIDRWRGSLVGVPTWVLQLAMRDGNRLNSALGPVLSVDRREESQQKLIDELRNLSGEVRATRGGVPLREAPPPATVPMAPTMAPTTAPPPVPSTTRWTPSASAARPTRRRTLAELSGVAETKTPPARPTGMADPRVSSLDAVFAAAGAGARPRPGRLGRLASDVLREEATGRAMAPRPVREEERALPVGRRFGPGSTKEESKKEEEKVGDTVPVAFAEPVAEMHLGEALKGVPPKNAVVYTKPGGNVWAIYTKPGGERGHRQVLKLPLSEYQKAGYRVQPSKKAAEGFYNSRIKK